MAKLTWIGGLARPFFFCWFIAVLAACSQTRPPATSGMVSGVLGVQVASSPGGAPSREIEGNVALLLGIQEVHGSTWYHILGADGTHGWTAKSLGQPQETTALPAVPSFSLSSRSPDDADFDSASEIDVAQGVVAQVIGGSRTSRPASIRNLMIPERLSRSIAPWLELKVGNSAGFSPAEWLSLHWNVGNGSAGSAADILRQSGLTGITRKPFLDPVAEILKKLAPQPGATLQHCQSANDRLDHKAVAVKWDQPDATILSAGTQASGLLVDFGAGESALFTFVSGAGSASHVWIEEGRPYVAQAQTIDLDNDGTPEWLLEVVSTYGDGYYSMLWVVKQTAAGDLQIDRIALSHSSGEAPAPATDAAWWVDPERKIWIVTAGTETTAQSFTYKHGLVPSPVKGTAKALVVLSNHPDYDSGMQSRLKMPEGASASGFFPIRSSRTVRWVVARPFEQLTDAKDWASKHSLPASSVLAVHATK